MALSCSNRRITSTNNGDFYCLNGLESNIILSNICLEQKEIQLHEKHVKIKIFVVL